MPYASACTVVHEAAHEGELVFALGSGSVDRLCVWLGRADEEVWFRSASQLAKHRSVFRKAQRGSSHSPSWISNASDVARTCDSSVVFTRRTT